MLNLTGASFNAYAGKIASQAYQRLNQKGSIVSVVIDFDDYVPAGLGIDTFGVVIDFKASATVPQPFNIASVYIDNLGNDVAVFLYFADTQQTVTVAPNDQGWFPVISNAPNATLYGTNLASTSGVTVQITFTDLFITPYVNSSLPEILQMQLTSPSVVIGAGGEIVSATIDYPGINYANGNVSVTGGGGSGAVIQGTVNGYGEFTALTIVDAGSGFIGTPILTATASNPPPAAWNSASIYTQGSLVSYAGIYYVAIQQNESRVPPSWPSLWQTYGNSSQQQTASLSASISSNTGFTTLGFGARAAGDQTFNVVDTITATGTFRNNLFGTPYSTGYIYLTNFHVHALNANVCEWTLQDNLGDIIFTFLSASAQGELFDLQGANIKLPATNTYSLNCTSHTSNMTVSHGGAFTYSTM